MKFCIFLLSCLLFLSCTNKEKEAADAKVKKVEEAKILRKKKDAADHELYLHNLLILDSIEEAKVKKYTVKKISGSVYGTTILDYVSYNSKVSEIVKKAKFEMLDDKYIAERILLLEGSRGGTINLDIRRSSNYLAQGYQFTIVVNDKDGKEIERLQNPRNGPTRYRKDDWFNGLSIDFKKRPNFPLTVHVIDAGESKKYMYKIQAIYK